MWKAVIDYGMGSTEDIEQDVSLVVLLSILETKYQYIERKVKDSYDSQALMKIFFEADRLEPEELSVTVTEDQLGQGAMEGVMQLECPYCHSETPAEPDAGYIVCLICNRRFKINNPYI